MRKIKSLVLAVIGLLCSVSVCAHDFEVDGIYYNITSSTDRTVAVTYRGNYSDSYSNEYSGAVSIPESVTYNGTILSVTSVEARTFYDCSRLTSVVIPNSITIVGEKAFSGCSGLTSVNITDVAAWCNINFGNGTANPLYYAKNLYLNGEKVTDLVIPDGITIIGNHTFYGCKSLVSVVIPNSVTCIEKSAFCNCSGLTSVVMGNSMTRIGDYAFNSCSSLTSVEIPNSVTSIGDYAFSICSGLTSVEIPNSVTSIGDGAFRHCSSLTSVVIPNSVTSIGDYAFEYCDRLTTATVGCSWITNPLCQFDRNVTVNATLHSYENGVCTVCGEEDTTGIDDITSNVHQRSEIFDLHGCRVNKAGKGLYIVNGKKVLVK